MLKIISHYTLTEYLNKGEYGKVYKAIDHQTQQNVAIKMIALDKFIQKSKLVELTRQEVQILSMLEKNPNVIKFKDVVKSSRFLYLVYEYCEGGTLEDYLRKRGRLGQKEAVKMFKQLINAYKSLHEHNIIHRDIKPDNILFKEGTLKLADFGFCKKLKFADDLTQTSLGSPLYMAPEVLNNDIYSSKADLWSCGVILYQLLFGKCPYGTCNIKELLTEYSFAGEVVFPQKQSREISDVVKGMLRRMLTKDQFRRMSWEEFLYEYQFGEDGSVRHREKDFEYDLMKLMKRNSSENGENRSQERRKAIKFDWSKVTDMNSSVHSEDCNHHSNHNSNSPPQQAPYSYQNGTSSNNPSQTHINFLYSINKQTKHFQQQHSKVYELLLLIESLLESKNPVEYDAKVLYFLVYNLGQILSVNIKSISEYLTGNQELLRTFPEERQKLERLKRIFTSQLEQNLTKINCIKISLIGLEDVGHQVFKYPKKSVMRKVMKEFIQSYQLEYQNLTDIKSPQNRPEAITLLKILWAVQLIFTQQQTISSSQQIREKVIPSPKQKFNDGQLLSIKQDTPKSQISATINRYLVRIGI